MLLRSTYFRIYMYIYYPLISTDFNILVINAGNGDDSLYFHASVCIYIYTCMLYLHIYIHTYIYVYLYICICISVINAGNGDDSLDYHASAVDPIDGSTLRNIAFQLPNILNARIDNTAFWWVISVYKCIHMFIYIVFKCMCIYSFSASKHSQCEDS
jgi:hypothetical protein